MSGIARLYKGAQGASGPLLTVGNARHAALGEWATIEDGSGQRRGQVIDVRRETTLLQVFEDTVGLAPARAQVTSAEVMPPPPRDRAGGSRRPRR